MNGTMMIIHSAYRAFYTSATVQAQIRFNDAYISIEGPATQNNKPYKIRLDNTDVQINGLKQYGGAFSTDQTLDQFTGYEPTHYEGWQVPSSANKTIFFVAEGYRGGLRGNEQDLRWTETKMRFKNCLTGPDVIGGGHSGGSDGVMEITQEFKLKITDADGDAIQGARYFLRDVNNGNRANYTENSNSDNYVSDRTYTGVSSATGETATEEVLTSDSVANNSNNDGAIRDHRFSDDVSATLTIPVWSYGHLYAAITDVDLFDEKEIVLALKMADDISVTGTSTQADAHDITLTADGETVQINESMSLDDLYDALKFKKTKEAYFELPTTETQFATAVGKILDFGLMDIIIATGSKLSPGTKFTSFITTGTKTGTTSAPFTDSTGSTLLLRSDPHTAIVSIREYESDGTTLTQTITGTTDADGVFATQVAADAMVTIGIKKYGYFPSRTTHDMADGQEVDISLVEISHIDTAQDLTGIADESGSGTADRLYFNWNADRQHGRVGMRIDGLVRGVCQDRGPD